MSLLRERAIDVSVESTLRERRPAEARAWFVRLTSCDSDAELNALMSQARVVRGAASRPTEVRPNARAVIRRTRRRPAGRAVRRSATRGRAVGARVIGGAVPFGGRMGSPVASTVVPTGPHGHGAMVPFAPRTGTRFPTSP